MHSWTLDLKVSEFHKLTPLHKSIENWQISTQFIYSTFSKPRTFFTPLSLILLQNRQLGDKNDKFLILPLRNIPVYLLLLSTQNGYFCLFYYLDNVLGFSLEFQIHKQKNAMENILEKNNSNRATSEQKKLKL